MLLDFSSIGIFILATTTINTRNSPQDYPTYYESRILPIVETWAAFFPQVYFVFGTNQFDYLFLKSKCRVNEAEKNPSSDKRRLVPHTPQMKMENATTRYFCQPDIGEGKWRPFAANHSSQSFRNIEPGSEIFDAYNSYLSSLKIREKPWKALYVGNCTGEYFGAGPTCRCQETMRYFLTQSKIDPAFAAMKWFVFMDDDVYIRPYSIQTFLSEAWRKFSAEDEPIVFISSETRHELRNIKHKKYEYAIQSCNTLFQNSYHLAQPAIMNRKAVEEMFPSIEANAHLRLQSIWGGSHDVILGLILWLYGFPMYSFNHIYSSVPLTAKPNYPQRIEKIHHRYFIFHRVLNFISYQWSKVTKTNQRKHTIASQYYIAGLLEDDYLYDQYKNLTREVFEKIILEQKVMGKKGINTLKYLQQSTVLFTKYYSLYGKNLTFNYIEDFKPSECHERN